MRPGEISETQRCYCASISKQVGEVDETRLTRRLSFKFGVRHRLIKASARMMAFLSERFLGRAEYSSEIRAVREALDRDEAVRGAG